MANLELRLRGDGTEPFVEFFVDAVNLASRLHEAFGDDLAEEILPMYGGDFKIADTVLGEEARTRGRRGAILFACECGYSACGSVVADIDVAEGAVVLGPFSTWLGRNRLIAPIEPITFDRDQFEQEVRRLLEALDRLRGE